MWGPKIGFQTGRFGGSWEPPNFSFNVTADLRNLFLVLSGGYNENAHPQLPPRNSRVTSTTEHATYGMKIVSINGFYLPILLDCFLSFKPVFTRFVVQLERGAPQKRLWSHLHPKTDEYSAAGKLQFTAQDVRHRQTCHARTSRSTTSRRRALSLILAGGAVTQ